MIERQIGYIRRIQRLYEDCEVDSDTSRGRRQRDNPDGNFPNQATELKLAKVHLQWPVESGRAVVTAVSGRIFQLTLRPSPKHLGDPTRVEATTARIHADPMAPDEGRATAGRIASLPPGLRSELALHWAMTTDHQAALLGPEEIYSVELPDGTYLVLGLLEDATMLMARSDPPGGGVRRYDPEGDLVADYGSLAEALAAGRAE